MDVGLAAVGRPGYINLGHAQDLQRSYGVAAMRERAHAVLDAAWSCGGRYFDGAMKPQGGRRDASADCDHVPSVRRRAAIVWPLGIAPPKVAIAGAVA